MQPQQQMNRDNPWAVGGAMPQPRPMPSQRSTNTWNNNQAQYQNVQPGYQQPRFRPLDENQEQHYSPPQYVAPYDRIQGTSQRPGYQSGAVVPYGAYPQGYGYGSTPTYIHPGAPYPGMVR
jgi:hypothetical protein